jgi:hypothetical protein
MKWVLPAERSSLTVALTLGASSHDGKVMVAARSTSLINSCARCAISLAAPVWWLLFGGSCRNPTAISGQPARRRVDTR